MSNIIATATQPTQAETLISWLLLLPWVAVAAGILLRAGVFRASTIVGPPRLAADERAVFLVILFLMTLGVGILASAAVLALPMEGQWKPLLAQAVFSIAGIVVMLVGNGVIRQDGLERFGMTGRLVATGLWKGVVGTLAVLPIVFVVGIVWQLVMRGLGLESPVHEVLNRLRTEASAGSIALLIVMAVVLAPLWEEMLFRGIVQTFLVRVLAGREVEVDGPEQGFPVVMEQISTAPVDDSPMARVELTESAVAPMARRVLARWMAIAIASLLFAAVHWQVLWFPPLIALSIGLGYAYEKTGNLWVPIVMHALFNGIQITLFLMLPNAG